MNTFNIDENEGFALLSSILLKMLNRHGWKHDEVEQRQKEIYLECSQAVREAREPITREIASFVTQCGFCELSLQGLVRTEYALRAFDLANTLTQRRQALCN